MAYARKAGWFVMTAVVLAAWMGVLGTLRGVAEAGVIASRLPDGMERSAEDLAAVQSFLENKVVAQKLMDYGVSPEEAMAKVRAMNPQGLHRLAALTDRTAEGTDGLGFVIGVAILVLIIVVIIKLLDKEIIIR